ncbi:MAG: nitrilase-related carbon-nitrogen hydrolase [Arhodomonas sp.]|nr:nitrilase-related carbon-nitrogen hydrolase [Arhodomonas sp.]
MSAAGGELQHQHHRRLHAGSYEDEPPATTSPTCAGATAPPTTSTSSTSPRTNASTGALEGGDMLRVFDTDVGRIGILVCYDVEFPELGRTLLAEQGMQILFVPFWTDTKNAYLRVRRCAQARAIENECYVAITGSVGNLPKVENIEIQYSQAAVFSPSDFAFPHDGIVAESTPNTEMTLITDLDMDRLIALREEGSVRNTRDRRLDLYRVEWHAGGSEGE